MVLFGRTKTIRRYAPTTYVDGYPYAPSSDIELVMDVQTTEDATVTTPDGTIACQRLKVFCDSELLVENRAEQQRADRLYHMGKWFDCISCRLSENTLLRHYLATFVECLDQDTDIGPMEAFP